MAKITTTGLDEFTRKLEAISAQAHGTLKQAVYEGAGILADEIKAGLERNLDSPRSASHSGGKFDRKQSEPTGDLLESFGISRISTDENDKVNALISFWGYDRKGVPNIVKARVMESGSSKVKKRPFMRPAVNRARKRALNAMRRVIEDGIGKILKG